MSAEHGGVLHYNEEIDRVFVRLAQDGTVVMPLGAPPMSKKFGWVADKIGVSW